MSALLVSFGQRKRDAELRATAGAGACGLDLAAVIGDDAIDNRQPESGALASALAGEERLEEVLEHLVGHAAAVVGEDYFGETRSGLEGDRERAARLDAIQRIGDQIEDDLLDFLGVHGRD